MDDRSLESILNHQFGCCHVKTAAVLVSIGEIIWIAVLFLTSLILLDPTLMLLIPISVFVAAIIVISIALIGISHRKAALLVPMIVAEIIAFALEIFLSCANFGKVRGCKSI